MHIPHRFFVVAVALLSGAVSESVGAVYAQPSPCEPATVAARRALIAAGQAVVSVPVAHLFERADPSGPLADQALFGQRVRIPPQSVSCQGPSDALLLVQTAAPYQGYVPLEALVPGPGPRSSASLLPGHAPVPLRVTSRLANVFRSPDVTAANPLWVLPLHSELALAEVISPRWLKVLLPDASVAYIQRGDVEPVPNSVSPPTVACLLSVAQKYEGTPYLWGGRSTLGVDCSGLVSSAFAACGVTAPRDAGPQMDWSSTVPVARPSELRPGDLVFFASGDASAGSPPKVAHVGIFVGNGRFLHATTSDRPVVHDSVLGDPEWQRRYLGARRYKTF